MLEYNSVKEKIESKIKDYSQKTSENKADFYKGLIAQLQKQLDNLNSKPDTYTLQDLIVAWQTYRECEQKRNLKFYTDNRWYIMGSIALFITIGVNVISSINRTKY